MSQITEEQKQRVMKMLEKEMFQHYQVSCKDKNLIEQFNELQANQKHILLVLVAQRAKTKMGLIDNFLKNEQQPVESKPKPIDTKLIKKNIWIAATQAVLSDFTSFEDALDSSYLASKLKQMGFEGNEHVDKYIKNYYIKHESWSQDKFAELLENLQSNKVMVQTGNSSNSDIILKEEPLINQFNQQKQHEINELVASESNKDVNVQEVVKSEVIQFDKVETLNKLKELVLPEGKIDQGELKMLCKLLLKDCVRMKERNITLRRRCQCIVRYSKKLHSVFE